MAQTAASLAGEISAGSRQSDFAFLLQVCRPGLWTTTALFYLMPLGHSINFSSAKFWVGLTYVLIPLGFVLYGVNDIFDVEADRLNPRKGTFLFGSLGRREQLSALRWQIVALQIPFVAAFLVWIGAQALVWFGVLLVAVALYNVPRIGFKTLPPFEGDAEGLPVELATFDRFANDRTKACDEENLYVSGTVHGISSS